MSSQAAETPVVKTENKTAAERKTPISSVVLDLLKVQTLATAMQWITANRVEMNDAFDGVRLKVNGDEVLVNVRIYPNDEFVHRSDASFKAEEKVCHYLDLVLEEITGREHDVQVDDPELIVSFIVLTFSEDSQIILMFGSYPYSLPGCPKTRTPECFCSAVLDHIGFVPHCERQDGSDVLENYEPVKPDSKKRTRG